MGVGGSSVVSVADVGLLPWRRPGRRQVETSRETHQVSVQMLAYLPFMFQKYLKIKMCLWMNNSNQRGGGLDQIIETLIIHNLTFIT